MNKLTNSKVTQIFLNLIVFFLPAKGKGNYSMDSLIAFIRL